jgi:hypothetical protein
METEIEKVITIPFSVKLVCIVSSHSVTKSQFLAPGTVTTTTYKYQENVLQLMASSAPLGASDPGESAIQCPFCCAGLTPKVRQHAYTAIPHSSLADPANRPITRRLFYRILLRAWARWVLPTAPGLLAFALCLAADRSIEMPTGQALAFASAGFLCLTLLVTTTYAAYCSWVFRTHSIIVRLGKRPSKLYAQISAMNGATLFRQIVEVAFRPPCSDHRLKRSHETVVLGSQRVVTGVDKERIAKSFFAPETTEKSPVHVFDYGIYKTAASRDARDAHKA